MRKHIAILSMLLFLLPLNASYFESNALGQFIASKESLSGTGYEGEVNNGRTVIYLDGGVVRERVETENGYTVTEDGYTESVTLDSSGRRISDRVDEDGAITARVYSDDGDRLSFVAITDGDGISRIIEYIDTPQGHLAGLAGDESGYLTPYFYVYSLDGDEVKVSLHAGDEEAEFIPDPSVYTIDEDGNWTGTSAEDGAERVYSPDGKLLSLTREDRTERYSYDEDGELSASDVTEGDTRTVSEYSEGRLVHSDIYIDGVIQTSRTYNEDGSMEEIRYRDGVKKSLILFDSDGLRIRRVENFR